FETYGDASQRRVDGDAITVSGSMPITLDGNTRAWPTIEIESTMTADDDVTVTVNRTGRDDHVVKIQGPLASSQMMRLDYDTMEFAVWQGETKVASLVNRMDNLDRLDFRQLEATTVTVTFSGTATGTAVVYPNSRRQ